jgi:hydroxylaminobenzene mutase
VSATAATTTAQSDLVRLLARAGAGLVLLGLLTGMIAGGALSGRFPFIDGRIILGAHVAALMGAFFIFAVAWSQPLLQLGDQGRTRLAWAVIVSNYANWLVTSVKSTMGVHGVDLSDDARNNAVFGVLTLLVVLPSLGAAVVWVWSLGSRSRSP